MKRGDIFSVSVPGDYGKPRPAVILQTNALNDVNFASVLVCPMTSHLVDAPLFRLNLKPSKANGLRKESQLMVDKVQAISVSRIGKLMGKVDSKTMKKVNQSIAFVLGLGESSNCQALCHRDGVKPVAIHCDPIYGGRVKIEV